jgi:hypothetical protein
MRAIGLYPWDAHHTPVTTGYRSEGDARNAYISLNILE